MEPAVRALAQRTIDIARLTAIKQHGPLKGGMARWRHHLREECQEAVDEMYAMEHKHNKQEQWEIRCRLLVELAQVAQLAQSMITALYMGKEREGEETWVEPNIQESPLSPLNPF